MEHTDEIKRIVARVLEVQRARKLSDRALLNEFPQLGSTKTWRQRLLAGNLDGLNRTRLLANLRRVETILDGGTPDEVYYGDLPFARKMHAQLGLLERQTNDRRILVCLAPNGVGKSCWARNAVATARASRVYVRMRPTWRNRMLYILHGFAQALGRGTESSQINEVEDLVIEELRGAPRTVVIDQAHEASVALMHILRAFVDETPSRFVYLAYATAYSRVLSARDDARVEAQAFLGRCLKPVFREYQHGTRAEDVQTYLMRRADLPASAAAGLAQRVLPVLTRTTNLRLLDDAIAVAEAGDDNNCPQPDVIEREVFRLSGFDPGAFKTSDEEDE